MWLLEQVRKLLFALSSLMSPLQIPIKPSRAGQVLFRTRHSQGGSMNNMKLTEMKEHASTQACETERERRP